MATTTCIIEGCDKHCEPGRRYCRKHFLERHRAQSRARYVKGQATRYQRTCLWCNGSYLAWRKRSIFCSMRCQFMAKGAMREEGTLHTSSLSGKEAFLHRYLSIRAVGEKVLQGYSLHHLDLNLDNNALSNLALLPQSKHALLHAYLTYEAVKRIPFGTPMRVFEMRKLIPVLTDEWFKKTNTKKITVQRLADEYKQETPGC